MALKLITPPAIEPVSLLEVKDHLRIDTGGLSAVLEIKQSILAGAYIPIPFMTGATVDVLGYSVMAILIAGTFGVGGKVDIQLRESADGITWTDVVGGAFATVDDTTDETVYELEYTGTKQYLRAIGQVQDATCEFGVSFVLRAPYSIEDALLSGFIKAAREYCEGYQNRAYIIQTWQLMLDDWPDSVIQIPLPPLQWAVPADMSITYYDTAGAALVVAPADYQVDTSSHKGRVCPTYGKTWPAATLQPMNGVVVQFKAGYGAAAVNVPERIRLAIKVLAGHMYENREATDVKEHLEVPFAVHSLLGLDRILPL